MTLNSGTPPPEKVLAAFGVAGKIAPLSGGQGTAWQVGDLILKPADIDETELRWQAETLSGISQHEVRVSYPLKSLDGTYTVQGWSAQRQLLGKHQQERWLDIIAAGQAFHEAVSEVPRPDFLDNRKSPWTQANQIAWGEASFSPYLAVEDIAALSSHLKPVDLPSQLIHGDLTGNILFATDLPPAIIDFSPYWRPKEYATAIVVADALVWHQAEPKQFANALRQPEFPQLLLRALLFRRVTDEIFGGYREQDSPYKQAIAFTCSLT